MAHDRHVGVERRQRRRGRLRLGLADRRLGVQDLALQVAAVHHVGVHDADRAHAGRGQVEAGGGAEAARADQQHLRLEQLAPGPPRRPRAPAGAGCSAPSARRCRVRGTANGRPDSFQRPKPPAIERDVAVAEVLEAARRQRAARAARAVDDDLAVAVGHLLLDPQLQEAAGDETSARARAPADHSSASRTSTKSAWPGAARASSTETSRISDLTWRITSLNVAHESSPWYRGRRAREKRGQARGPCGGPDARTIVTRRRPEPACYNPRSPWRNPRGRSRLASRCPTS